MPIVLFLVLVIIVTAAIGFRAWKRRALRKDLLASALSDHQRDIISVEVPLVQNLPPDLKAKLEGKMRLFLHQVEFIGCNGQEITDGIRLSIAAQACLLIVNTDAWYKTLRTILVYPSAFKSRQARQDGFIVREANEIRLGESWAHGPVVLSWPHAKQGAVDENDGQNLVLHEFAHQLDSLSGSTNGVPIFGKSHSFSEWEAVILDAYERHLQNVEKRRKTILDAYGAENHAEFFAVTIEVFFEKPARLKMEEPEVYAQFSKLLGLDPTTWG